MTDNRQNSSQGIILRFYKSINPSENIPHENSFVLWGYMDYLSHHNFSSLRDCGNKKSLLRMSQGEQGLIEEQHLYLFKNPSLNNLRPNNKPLNWIFGQNKHNSLPPLIVITQVRNFSPGDYLSWLGKNDPQLIKTDLFQTLGHSSDVIIFRGYSYQQITNRVISLNEICESSYSIAGFTNCKEAFLKHPAEALTKNTGHNQGSSNSNSIVSIKYNLLKTNGTNPILATHNKITTIFDQYNASQTRAGQSVNAKINVILGRFDIELRLEGGQHHILNLLQNPKYGFARIDSAFYYEHIIESRTIWHTPAPKLPTDNCNLTRKPKLQKDYNLEIAQPLMDHSPTPIRMGLLELKNNFHKLADSRLADIKSTEIICEFIQNFIDALSQIGAPLHENPFTEKQIIGIDNGINFINQAISNRLQSSRYLFEAKSFNPLNIGSLSQLHLFYEKYIELIERIINRYHQQLDNLSNQQTSFLLDISVHSSPSAQSLAPTHEDFQHPTRMVGITINEFSFFNPKDTLRILCHEMGHYVSPNKKAGINKNITDVVISLLAEQVNFSIKKTYFPNIDVLKNKEGDLDKTESAVLELADSFNRKVLMIIRALLISAFEEHHSEYIKKINETAHNYKGSDTLKEMPLDKYFMALDEWTHSLNKELGRTLLDQEKNNSLFLERLQEILREVMVFHDDNLDYEEQEEDQLVNPFLWSATLLNDGQIFSYTQGKGNLKPHSIDAFDLYINVLMDLGLNENNEKNLVHLCDHLIKHTKEELTRIINDKFIVRLKDQMGDIIADIFMIETLDMDFKEYQELTQTHSQEQKFDNELKNRIFRTRESVIRMYYGLPINSPDDEGKSRAPYVNIIEENVLKPIGEHLFENRLNIFPPDKLFNNENSVSSKADSRTLDSIRSFYKSIYEKEQRSTPSLLYEVDFISSFIETI